MRSIARCVWSLLLLTCTTLSQNAQPSPTAQELLTKGKELYTQEGPKAALPLFEEALKILRSSNDRRGEAVTLGYIANCYRKLETLDKALEYAQQALHMKEDLGERGEIGNTQNQLGLIYWELADYPAAIQHLEQAIEIASGVGDKELEEAALNNLGLVFDEQATTRARLSNTGGPSNYTGRPTLNAGRVTRWAISAEFTYCLGSSGRRCPIIGRPWRSANA